LDHNFGSAVAANRRGIHQFQQENQANSILQGGTLRGQVREIVRGMVLLETPYNGGGNNCA
jgi:hypothetical protein